MANINHNYRENIKAFWKYVNGTIESSAKSSIQTFCDDNGSIEILILQVRSKC